MTVSLTIALAPFTGNAISRITIDSEAVSTEPLASVAATVLAFADRRAITPLTIRSPQTGTTSFIGFMLPGKGDHRVQLLISRTVSLQVLSGDVSLHQRVRQHFTVTCPSDAAVSTALGPVLGSFKRGADHYVSGDWSPSRAGIAISADQAAAAAAIKTQIAVGVLDTVYPKLLALL